MVDIRHENAADGGAREALLDRAFGRRRRLKTSERLREARLAAEGLAFTATGRDGRVIGTVRLWDVIAGSAGPALLLGPLAVDGRQRKRGVGRALMERALNEARVRGHRAVLLVGDLSYYGRFGFGAEPVADLRMPGPVEAGRFLGLELVAGALDGAEGAVIASGALEDQSRQVA